MRTSLPAGALHDHGAKSLVSPGASTVAEWRISRTDAWRGGPGLALLLRRAAVEAGFTGFSEFGRVADVPVGGRDRPRARRPPNVKGLVEEGAEGVAPPHEPVSVNGSYRHAG